MLGYAFFERRTASIQWTAQRLMTRQTATTAARRCHVAPRIELPGPWCLQIDRRAGNESFDYEWRLLRTGPHSLLFRSQGPNPWIIKLIKPRSTPRDQLRKYFHAQALREYAGARHLNRIGLLTPATHGWGVALSPWSAFESVLFMDPLPDFISGLAVVRTETRADIRRHFLNQLAAGVAAIHGHDYIHKDCHFDNVCWLGDGRIAWIDNDIRKARSATALTRGFKKTLALLYKTARDHIPNDEWCFFVQQLKIRLKDYPNGTILCHEIR